MGIVESSADVSSKGEAISRGVGEAKHRKPLTILGKMGGSLFLLCGLVARSSTRPREPPLLQTAAVKDYFMKWFPASGKSAPSTTALLPVTISAEVEKKVSGRRRGKRDCPHGGCCSVAGRMERQPGLIYKDPGASELNSSK
jgi:hypothetical protein